MIEGHGDDIYRYEGIRMNFSSNIYAQADLSELEAHLCRHIGCIRSYPEPPSHTLERLLAQQQGISPDEVLVTNGATDAIYLIAQAFRNRRTYQVFPPTFSEYEDACHLFGYEEHDQADLCWLCNPNNPTGEVLLPSQVQALAARHALLVLDQSYEHYTLSPLLTPQQAVAAGNILQLHSMTKQYAIPGLRLGYVVAASPLITHLRHHSRPWAVNALAVEAAKWLLTHHTSLSSSPLSSSLIPSLSAYLQETHRLQTLLRSLDGIGVADTQTNFFLCAIECATAAELKEYLARHHGILIRDASNFRGLTPHHFRIATQSPGENDALVAAIALFLQQR